MNSPIHAIVLAAGLGSRFDPSGQHFKLLQTLPDGRPIIRASCQTLLSVLRKVSVVCGNKENGIRSALADLPVDIVSCADAALGMGATIRCGARASSPTTGWLIMLADMPYVQVSTVDSVTHALLDGADIARPFFQGQPGHPVGFSTRLANTLRYCDPHSGLKKVIQQHGSQMARIEVNDPGATHDVDYPADII